LRRRRHHAAVAPGARPPFAHRRIAAGIRNQRGQVNRRTFESFAVAPASRTPQVAASPASVATQ
jgi:hypothetical protein